MVPPYVLWEFLKLELTEVVLAISPRLICHSLDAHSVLSIEVLHLHVLVLFYTFLRQGLT